jgi:hypothetical protein
MQTHKSELEGVLNVCLMLKNKKKLKIKNKNI